LVAIGLLFYSRLPKSSSSTDPGIRFSVAAFSEILPFTAATIYTALLSAFLTQFDKVLLSRVLPLELYGYFSFAILIANGVMRIAQPVNQAILPRLTLYVAQDDREAATQLYARNTQFLVVLAFPISAMLACFPWEVLFILSGDQTLSDFGAPVLRWFALGNGVLVLWSILLSLQTAYGQMKLHVWSSTVLALIQVPAVAYFALLHGAEAVGLAWLVILSALFTVFAPFVHQRFRLGSFPRWVLVDVGLPLLGTAVGAGLVFLANEVLLEKLMITGRLELLAVVAFFTIITTVISASCASEVREFLVYPTKLFGRIASK
jgi:O-antigen/teichoic acid export membrane protein